MSSSDNSGSETTPIVLNSHLRLDFSSPQQIQDLNNLSIDPETGRIAIPLLTSAATSGKPVEEEYKRYQAYTFKDGKPHTFSPNGIDGYPFDPSKDMPGKDHRAVWHVNFDGVTVSLGAEIGGQTTQEAHSHPKSPELVFAADETGVIYVDTPKGRQQFKSPALLYFPASSEHSIVFRGNHYTVDFKNIAFGDRVTAPSAASNSDGKIEDMFKKYGIRPVEVVDSRSTSLRVQFINRGSKLKLPAGVLNIVFPLTQDTAKIAYNGIEATASFLQPHALYNKGPDYNREPIKLEDSTSDLFLVQCPINMLDSKVIEAFNY